MRTEYSNWRKLDNAALAFPLVTGENDTRVFRFYCQLKEEVDSDILQQALDRTMEKYPLFQAVLRKGLFWFYLEHSHIRALVKPETEPPCSRLYIPDKKSLLFQVEQAEASKRELVAGGLKVSQLEDEEQWKKVAIEKVWPEMADFVGGKDAINEYLKACGKQPWN